MKNALIFDLDGTLWDSSRQCAGAWTRALSRTDAARIVTAEDMHRFMGKTMEQIADMLLPDIEKTRRAGLMQLCTNEEYSYLEENHGELYDGAEEVLKKLRGEYRLFIVSNSLDGYVQLFLRTKGLGEYFEDYEMWGRTMLPKGDNIRLVMERNGLARAAYIGDTEGDRAAAEQAGIPFIHAAYGFGTVGTAAAVINSIKELPEAAERVFGKEGRDD
ncbi:MAG: HAD family hydrolase [Oscillospiraceae bacterium]